MNRIVRTDLDPELTLADKWSSWRDYSVFVIRNASRMRQMLLVISTVLLIISVSEVAHGFGVSFWVSTGLLLLMGGHTVHWVHDVAEFSRNDKTSLRKRTELMPGGHRATIASIQPSPRQLSL
jgi:hypothetical protein